MPDYAAICEQSAAGLMIIHDVQREHGRAEGKLLVEASEVARSIEDADRRAGRWVVALALAGRPSQNSRLWSSCPGHESAG